MIELVVVLLMGIALVGLGVGLWQLSGKQARRRVSRGWQVGILSVVALPVEPDSYPEVASDPSRIVDYVHDHVRPGSIIESCAGGNRVALAAAEETALLFPSFLKRRAPADEWDERKPVGPTDELVGGKPSPLGVYTALRH